MRYRYNRALNQIQVSDPDTPWIKSDFDKWPREEATHPLAHLLITAIGVAYQASGLVEAFKEKFATSKEVPDEVPLQS